MLAERQDLERGPEVVEDVWFSLILACVMDVVPLHAGLLAVTLPDRAQGGFERVPRQPPVIRVEVGDNLVHTVLFAAEPNHQVSTRQRLGRGRRAGARVAGLRVVHTTVLKVPRRRLYEVNVKMVVTPHPIRLARRRRPHVNPLAHAPTPTKAVPVDILGSRLNRRHRWRHGTLTTCE